MTRVDVFLNIIKRKESILYRTSVSLSSAGLAYISGANIDVNTSLSISDRSTSLAANRATRGTPTTITGTKTFNIDTDNFVVTDVYTQQTSTISPTPLFYKHILGLQHIPRENTTLYTLSDGVKILDVQFLDLTFQPYKVTEMYLDELTGIVYNNLASYFTSSKQYSYFYVKYTVRNAGTVSTYIELLDNRTTYRLASYGDLDSELQIIRDGRKVYLIDETDVGFEVTLPIIGTYSFKPLSTARLQVLSPLASNASSPWYVRVTNGKFYASINSTTYKYYIAEFDNQTFYPEAPYKLASQIEPVIINATALKMQHSSLVEDPSLEMGTSIYFTTTDGVGVAAFTTLDSVAGTTAPNGATYVKWSTLNPVGIRSIDQQNGFVDIDGFAINSNWNVRASYFYAETTYVLSLLNFNPNSNKDILTNRIVVFIDPDSGSTVKEQTVYYLKIDPSGKVIESNWPSFDNETEQAFGEDIYFGNAPSWKPPGPTRTNFLEVYSTEGSGSYLVLAEVSVSIGTAPEDQTIIDARVHGGGVVEDKVDEAVAICPEAAWCWDVGQWDGTPYPGNATYFVEIPVDVFEEAGGDFTQQEVTDIVRRHTALGVYPVIRAYSNEITVSGVAWHDPRLPLERSKY